MSRIFTFLKKKDKDGDHKITPPSSPKIKIDLKSIKQLKKHKRGKRKAAKKAVETLEVDHDENGGKDSPNQSSILNNLDANGNSVTDKARSDDDDDDDDHTTTAFTNRSIEGEADSLEDVDSICEDDLGATIEHAEEGVTPVNIQKFCDERLPQNENVADVRDAVAGFTKSNDAQDLLVDDFMDEAFEDLEGGVIELTQNKLLSTDGCGVIPVGNSSSNVFILDAVENSGNGVVAPEISDYSSSKRDFRPLSTDTIGTVYSSCDPSSDCYESAGEDFPNSRNTKVNDIQHEGRHCLQADHSGNQEPCSTANLVDQVNGFELGISADQKLELCIQLEPKGRTSTIVEDIIEVRNSLTSGIDLNGREVKTCDVYDLRASEISMEGTILSFDEKCDSIQEGNVEMKRLVTPDNVHHIIAELDDKSASDVQYMSSSPECVEENDAELYNRKSEHRLSCVGPCQHEFEVFGTDNDIENKNLECESSESQVLDNSFGNRTDPSLESDRKETDDIRPGIVQAVQSVVSSGTVDTRQNVHNVSSETSLNECRNEIIITNVGKECITNLSSDTNVPVNCQSKDVFGIESSAEGVNLDNFLQNSPEDLPPDCAIIDLSTEETNDNDVAAGAVDINEAASNRNALELNDIKNSVKNSALDVSDSQRNRNEAVKENETFNTDIDPASDKLPQAVQTEKFVKPVASDDSSAIKVSPETPGAFDEKCAGVNDETSGATTHVNVSNEELSTSESAAIDISDAITSDGGGEVKDTDVKILEDINVCSAEDKQSNGGLDASVTDGSGLNNIGDFGVKSAENERRSEDVENTCINLVSSAAVGDPVICLTDCTHSDQVLDDKSICMDDSNSAKENDVRLVDEYLPASIEDVTTIGVDNSNSVKDAAASLVGDDLSNGIGIIGANNANSVKDVSVSSVDNSVASVVDVDVSDLMRDTTSVCLVGDDLSDRIDDTGSISKDKSESVDNSAVDESSMKEDMSESTAGEDTSVQSTVGTPRRRGVSVSSSSCSRSGGGGRGSRKISRCLDRQMSLEDELSWFDDEQQREQAEARLAQRRAARAEARELRLKELEKHQQQNPEDDASDMSDGGGGGSRITAAAAGSGDVAPPAPPPPLYNRRSSQDSGTEDSASKDIREVEEKFRGAMISNAQLDNEKSQLTYQVEILKDVRTDITEQLTQLKKEHKKKCSEHEQLRKIYAKLEAENKMVRGVLEERDQLIQEYGLLVVGRNDEDDEDQEEEEEDDGADSLAAREETDDGLVLPRRIPMKRVLLSQEASKILEKGAARGSLEWRLRRVVEHKRELEDELRRVNLELEDQVNSQRQNNCIDSNIQKEANKTVNEYKFKVQKAEAEVASLQANVNRLDALVARYRVQSEELEKSEEELKLEKRKLQRELREAQSRLEEIETTNSHLLRRFDKLKNARSNLLKDLSQDPV